MMKLLGLFLVVCCGAGTGLLGALRLRQERTCLERLCRMLRELSVQMRFRGASVQELLEQLCRESAYDVFSFLPDILTAMEQGMPLCEAWHLGIGQDKAVPDAAKQLLLPLGEELGASDLEGQVSTLAQYRRQLESYAEEAGTRCAQRQRLYCSLGFFGGMTAAILLC